MTPSAGTVDVQSAFARLLDAASATARAVDLGGRPDPSAGVIGLMWSPAGDSVANLDDHVVTVQVPGAPSHTVRLELDGQALVAQCLNGWSPTGRRLLVVATAPGKGYFEIGDPSILLSVDPAGRAEAVVVRGWEPGWPYGICGVTSWQPLPAARRSQMATLASASATPVPDSGRKSQGPPPGPTPTPTPRPVLDPMPAR